MTRSCPECGRAWTDRAVFCGACGAALSPAPPGATPEGPPIGQAARRGVAIVAVVLLVGGALAWQFQAAGPRSATADGPTAEPDVVNLPAPGADTTPPTAATDVPPDLVATCRAWGDPSGCVRWVQPGPRSSFGGVAPVAGDGGTVVVGDQDQVRGLDVATGQTRWTAGLSGAALVVRRADDVALVQDLDGVSAFDMSDGDVLWSVPDATLVARSPRDDPLAVALLGSTTEDFVTARDLHDGTVRWTIGGAGMPVTVTRLDRALLLVGRQVVDAATGEVAWDTGRIGVGAQPVAAAAGRVLTLEHGEEPARLVLRAATDGRPVAGLDVDPADVRGTTVVGDHVIVQTADVMTAYRLADGREAWQRRDRRGVLLAAPPAVGPYPGLPGITVAADGLAVRRADGTILVLDPTSGSVRTRLGSPSAEGVDLGDGMVADGRVFKLDDDHLRVFDLDRGTLLIDAVVRTPEVVSTTPLVVLTAGRLVRLDVPAGAQ